MHAPDIERWERTRTQLAKNNLDALVCRLTENVLQLSGYWPILGRSVVIFPREGEPVLLAPVSEEGEAERGWISDVRTFRAWRIGDIDPEASLTKLLHQFFSERGLLGKRIGYEGSYGDIAAPQRFFEPWAGIHTVLASWVNASGGGEWVDFGPQLVDLSGEKTEREIARIRVANEVADFGLGATVLDPNKVDVVAEVRKRTNGAGVDLVLDDAGHSETLTMALQASRIQGRVVEVGIFEKPCTFNINDLVLKERELIGILNTGCMIPTALKLMAAGRVDPTLLISNRIDLEDVVEKGFKECIVHKDTNVKVIVNSNPDLWDT